MKPSADDVLRLLRKHPEGITSLMALEEAGCFRLGARVYELRREGYAISSQIVRTPTGKSVARYTLDEPGTLFGHVA